VLIHGGISLLMLGAIGHGAAANLNGRSDQLSDTKSLTR
jgi:hypothetical protein